MEDYYNRRTAKWIGKILRMESDRDPRKLITSWIDTARSVGRLIMNLGHAYKKVITKCNLGESYEQIKDRAQNQKEWDSQVDEQLDFPRNDN